MHYSVGVLNPVYWFNLNRKVKCKYFELQDTYFTEKHKKCIEDGVTIYFYTWKERFYWKISNNSARYKSENNFIIPSKY